MCIRDSSWCIAIRVGYWLIQKTGTHRTSTDVTIERKRRKKRIHACGWARLVLSHFPSSGFVEVRGPVGIIIILTKEFLWLYKTSSLWGSLSTLRLPHIVATVPSVA